MNISGSIATTAVKTRPSMIEQHVSAGILMDSKSRVLIAQRPTDKPFGGWWEFPGGKLEPGETPCQALRREIHEETGAHIVSVERFMRLRYKDEIIHRTLHFFKILEFSGFIHGREGQNIMWLPVEALSSWPMLRTNNPVVCALNLPLIYAITPLVDEVDCIVNLIHQNLRQRHHRLIQLRQPHWNWAQTRAASRSILDQSRSRGARILINADPAWATELGFDGVHLNATRLHHLTSRPLDCNLVGASCHNIEDLIHAQRIHVDFVVLSPLFPKNQNGSALGWRGFGRMIRAVNLPVYALGGMHPTYARHIRRLGGHGVAGIRAFWQDQDSKFFTLS